MEGTGIVKGHGERISHPYCITSEHVAIIRRVFDGKLSRRSILTAERAGVCCGTCGLGFEVHGLGRA